MEPPIENENEVLARRLYAEWDQGRGVAKSELERRTWNDGSSHGRRFDRFIFNHLGINTTKSSKQTNQIEDLKSQVRSLGQHPVGTTPTSEEIHLLHSRKACLSALQIWNDPIAPFRTGAFSLLFVTAWNNLALALAKRNEIEWRDLDKFGRPVPINDTERALDTYSLIKLVLPEDDNNGTRENIRYWIDLRNKVAHHYLPELDTLVIPEAQAGLLNFERIVTEEFGEEYSLAEHLSVPLHLTGFRNPDVLASLKQAQANLPLEIQTILSRTERTAPELLADDTYSLRVAFVPFVPASGTSPDTVAYFVRPGEVPNDLQETLTNYIILPKVSRSSRPGLRPSDVVKEVLKRIPFKFNNQDHAKVARYLKIRPERGQPDQSLDENYCEYITSIKTYLYNQKWIDRVVEEISTSEGYKKATGRNPVQKP